MHLVRMMCLAKIKSLRARVRVRANITLIKLPKSKWAAPRHPEEAESDHRAERLPTPLPYILK